MKIPARTTLQITNLSLRTIIGFNDWEREKKQDIVINVSMEFNPSEAILNDDVDKTLDYKKIKRNIIDLVENSSFFLLEKLTHAILETVMADPVVLSSKVRVDKPHALRFAESVSVEMSAER